MERPPTPEAYQRISQNLQFLHSWKMQRLIIKGQDQNMRSSSQILLVFRITNPRLSLSLTFKSKFSAQPQLVAGAVEAGKRSLSAGQHWLFTCCRTEFCFQIIQNFTIPASALGLYCNHSCEEEWCSGRNIKLMFSAKQLVCFQNPATILSSLCFAI